MEGVTFTCELTEYGKAMLGPLLNPPEPEPRFAFDLSPWGRWLVASETWEEVTAERGRAWFERRTLPAGYALVYGRERYYLLTGASLSPVMDPQVEAGKA